MCDASFVNANGKLDLFIQKKKNSLANDDNKAKLLSVCVSIIIIRWQSTLTGCGQRTHTHNNNNSSNKKHRPVHEPNNKTERNIQKETVKAL